MSRFGIVSNIEDQYILIVDDEEDIRFLVGEIIKDRGYKVVAVANARQALKRIADKLPVAVILDVWLDEGGMDGISLLKEIKAEYSNRFPVLIMSGHGNTDTAVKAIKMGAYDYIAKPFTEDRISLTLARAIEANVLRQENRRLRNDSIHDGVLIGESKFIKDIVNIVSKLKNTNSRVLITGDSGVGKSVVARFIHNTSNRSKLPFVVLQASSLTGSNMYERLFGVESAESKKVKVGLVEKANGGTLFLDEIADLSHDAQSALLRVLQSKSIRRLGATSDTPVDIRIVSSSASDLRQSIASGLMREDFYYRLNVVPVAVSPLSSRVDDIPLLCRHFIQQLSEKSGLPKKIISEEAYSVMKTYNWPGNIRQLKNVVEWLLIMSSSGTNGYVDVKDLPPDLFSDIPNVSQRDDWSMVRLPLKEARDEFERQYLKAQLMRFGGNVSKTSEFVQMDRSALHRKIKSLEVVDDA